jgi:hypothetical protein
LEGEDADQLLASLEDTASPEEIERRRARARAFLDAVKEGPVTTATTGVVLIPKG